jgi:hypothetical protein
MAANQRQYYLLYLSSREATSIKMIASLKVVVPDRHEKSDLHSLVFACKFIQETILLSLNPSYFFIFRITIFTPRNNQKLKLTTWPNPNILSFFHLRLCLASALKFFYPVHHLQFFVQFFSIFSTLLFHYPKPFYLVQLKIFSEFPLNY